jgi:hypothetical protein
MGRRKQRRPSLEPEKSASGDEDAPGRLAADYGLWVGSYVRGDLPSMRTHAAAFLAGVAARPDSPEAGVAHRVLGTAHCFAGEYAEAREHLERALALFQPGRDDDLAFRFGQDAGVAAMCYLAIASWPLGNVRRAVSLVDGAHERPASVAHTGTHPYAKLHAAVFELMRGDRARAAQNGVTMICRCGERTGRFLKAWRRLNLARLARGSARCAAASRVCASKAS